MFFIQYIFNLLLDNGQEIFLINTYNEINNIILDLRSINMPNNIIRPNEASLIDDRFLNLKLLNSEDFLELEKKFYNIINTHFSDIIIESENIFNKKMSKTLENILDITKITIKSTEDIIVLNCTNDLYNITRIINSIPKLNNYYNLKREMFDQIITDDIRDKYNKDNVLIKLAIDTLLNEYNLSKDENLALKISKLNEEIKKIAH